MNNFKRHITLVFALFLAIILGACNQQTESAKDTASNNVGDSESVEEEKTLRIITSIVGGKTPEEHAEFEKEIERLTGIKVQMEKIPSDYDQSLLTSISAGEKYDLIYMTKPMMDVLVEQGTLTELTDQIKSSEVLSDPTVIPAEEWELITYDDGKIYSVFNKFEGGTMPTVRQDWMEKLGLEEPTTLDEYYEVLKAFTEQDPNGTGKDDTYGLTTAGLYDIQGFMSAVGVKARYVIDENGNRSIPYATEDAIPVYEWFAKLYEEGILDPNFATNDGGNMQELFLGDRVGMVTYWDAWVGLFNNIRLNEDPDTEFRAKGLNGVPGPDGNIMLRRGDPSVWAIPVNAENPEVALEFLEFWHTIEGNTLSTLGVKDLHYTVDESGNYELTELGEVANMDHGVVFPNNTNWENPFGKLPGVEEAQEIIMAHAQPEISTENWPDAQKIVERYAFAAITGDLSADEAVEKMHSELKASNLID